jgi:Na+/proline symporter/signal transduction histidine kinase
MLQGWVVVACVVVYIGLLFAVASYGDRARRKPRPGGRPWIYSLTLAVYCTSWTFLGSVGLATRGGLEFLTIYIGPALLFLVGFPILRRVIRLAKAEKITSIADFIAARYGKSQAVAAVVTLIAVVGCIPYIALQLKAVSISVETMIQHLAIGPPAGAAAALVGDVALFVAFAMAVFAILFGTRHADATEHQEGLMLAVATESVVKLIAFLVVGTYVTFAMFGGAGALIEAVRSHPEVEAIFEEAPNGGTWLVLSMLSFVAALMLPRQFHVTVTENNSDAELKRAVWLFPLYLLVINIFVVPIAAAGMIRFGGTADADTFVLALPMFAGADAVTLAAFAGALSAATAMVIVETVALSIMISNDIVIPLLVSRRGGDVADMRRTLLTVRRATIVGLVLLAYVYYRAAGDSAALAQIGLLSFAAIAQFAPAFFGGLIWRRATARGAIAGMLTGFAVWVYTLLLPNFVANGLLPATILENGPFGLWLLRPQALFTLAFDPFIHGVFWSIAANVGAFVFFSLTRAPEPLERLQASIFVPSDLGPAPALRFGRTAVTVGDLKATVARYLGAERAERSFAQHATDRGVALSPHLPADPALLRFSEQLLASAVGAASSRLVLSLLVKRRDPATKSAHRLLDDATAAIQHNRDLLQTALDQVDEGIAVFDPELGLSCWNRRFRTLLGLPQDFGLVGTPLRSILARVAEDGGLGSGEPDRLVADRIARLLAAEGEIQERIDGRVVEARSSPMPDGGLVLTVADTTERVLAAEALERRVLERTDELLRLNEELVRAKAAAEDANLGKTRFLAAAGHDILQPLNAARLYVTTLVDRTGEGPLRPMVENVGASLESVEEIIGAVLDISRLDGGAMKSEPSVFSVDELLQGLAVEFAPIARERGLELVVLRCSLAVRTDRRLLRRLLQNLISNAVKYTQAGRVLVGCRRHGGSVSIEVLDTGIGIPLGKQKAIFTEFLRLEPGMKAAKGLGLGLSIVERIARVLDLTVTVSSRPGAGSRFAVAVPVSREVPVRRATAPSGAFMGVPLTPLVALCIDNEPTILDGMAALLSGWGCRAITAASLADALAALDAAPVPPDVVIVDYHLDDGDGLAAVAALRRRLGESLPAILITADRTPEVRAAAAAAGVTLLNKPLKPAMLRALLARVGADRAAAE